MNSSEKEPDGASANQWYVYILRCADDTYYIGYARDLDARVDTHNAGKGAKYTRGRLPVELVYHEVFDTQSEAMSREYHLKKLSRRQKQALINTSIATHHS